MSLIGLIMASPADLKTETLGIMFRKAALDDRGISNKALGYSAELASRCSAGASIENLLALSIVAFTYKQYGVSVPSRMVLLIENQMLNIYRSSHDTALGLFRERLTSMVDAFYIQKNYDFCIAMALIYHSVPRYKIMARFFFSSVGRSIVSVFGFSNEDGLGFFDVAQRSRKTLEINKYVDDRYRCGSMYAYSLALIAPELFGPVEFYSQSYAGRIEDGAEIEYVSGIPLFGAARGYDRSNYSISSAVDKFERRYPFIINLTENLKALAFTPERTQSISGLLSQINSLSHEIVINEYMAIESDPFSNEPTQAYSLLAADGVRLDGLRMDLSSMGITGTAYNRPQAITDRDIADFSWGLMPENWKNLNDKTTRGFHDALLSSLQYGYNKISNLHNSLNPVTADEKIIDWLCFINGVPSNSIPLLSKKAKGRLIGTNRAILNRRSTLPAMQFLNGVFNDDLPEFLIKKPYQPFSDTVFRHTNGNIWVFEIEPNLYSETGIKRLWKALSSSYVSARYLLILVGLNALSRLNGSGEVLEWVPGTNYPENSIITQAGRVWRRLAPGDTLPPDSRVPLWRQEMMRDGAARAYDAGIYYTKGARVIGTDGLDYTLNGDYSIGKDPVSGYMLWGGNCSDPQGH